MANKSKNQIEIDSRRKIYEQIAIKSRREICLNSRIEKAANGLNMSKNAFLLYAVEKELSALGYDKDALDMH